MPTVNSSHINSIEYDAASLTLTVVFKNGAKYAYTGVPQQLYEALMQAPSVGGFFMSKIKNGFAARRLQ